ncbi:hypothetical protein BN85403870 [Alteracholeplasma palmae J233]|uniref:Uncharacterized protein n=1 Tax=Alteracholeplasma palmae (strain ATCC 49389 / J233) TaxID=1318466 RepID=U4KK25_ALTPJ|nr:hypothetical protein [Alteracholeplasma palmae]CCV63964.1 hypothetical protein BN85403870 [Alteracholeplasma palmae J233]
MKNKHYLSTSIFLFLGSFIFLFIFIMQIMEIGFGWNSLSNVFLSFTLLVSGILIFKKYKSK